MMQDMGPSLDSMQFGHRKERPTVHYLADLLHFVLSEVEFGRYMSLLMIEYSKAFDKVDITVALSKLISMGLPPGLLTWIGDFLTKRQQCVRYAPCYLNGFLPPVVFPKAKDSSYCFSGDGQPDSYICAQKMEICG